MRLVYSKYDNPEDIRPVKILAFGPHPDDVEFACSGTIINYTSSGKNAAVIDMSLGELATNGTVDIRLEEAAESAAIMGLDYRFNLEIPNNKFYNSTEVQNKIIKAIRILKPQIILLPYKYDRHPDHEFASSLIREAVFTAGLIKYEIDNTEPHRPKFMYFYELWEEFDNPSLYVDISESFETKMKAIKSYRSQFELSGGAKKTIDNSGGLFKYVESRAFSHGFKISVKYAEAFKNVYNEVGVKNFDNLYPNLF